MAEEIQPDINPTGPPAAPDEATVAAYKKLGFSLQRPRAGADLRFERAKETWGIGAPEPS